MKTQKTTARKDNRTIEQVARSIAAMRRRVAAAMRRHAKLQSRIAKLQAAGRIVSLDRDNDIIVGISGWYLKSDSLNPDPDSISNWYYEVTYSEQCGYGCSCESLSPNGCKHIRQLGATFAPVAKVEEKRDLVATGTLNNANRGFSLLRV